MESIIVTCPHCNAKNRIPVDKSDAPATCGRCHQPLAKPDSQEHGEHGEHKDHGNIKVTLRCSQCRAKNRVQVTKLHSGALCGKCGAVLQHEHVLDGRPLMVDEASFDRLVMQSPLPVLLYCWAPWCSVCGSTTPMVEALASETNGKVRVAKLNVDQNPNLASRFNIMGVPAFFIIDGGEIKHHFPGAIDRHDLMMKMAAFIY